MRYKIPAVKIIEWSYNFRITVEDSVQIRHDAILAINKRRMLNQLHILAALPSNSNFALKSGIDNNRPGYNFRTVDDRKDWLK
jgi:hypothetical protein